VQICHCKIKIGQEKVMKSQGISILETANHPENKMLKINLKKL